MDSFNYINRKKYIFIGRFIRINFIKCRSIYYIDICSEFQTNKLVIQQFLHSTQIPLPGRFQHCTALNLVPTITQWELTVHTKMSSDIFISMTSSVWSNTTNFFNPIAWFFFSIPQQIILIFKSIFQDFWTCFWYIFLRIGV